MISAGRYFPISYQLSGCGDTDCNSARPGLNTETSTRLISITDQSQLISILSSSTQVSVIYFYGENYPDHKQPGLEERILQIPSQSIAIQSIYSDRVPPPPPPPPPPHCDVTNKHSPARRGSSIPTIMGNKT